MGTGPPIGGYGGRSPEMAPFGATGLGLGADPTAEFGCGRAPLDGSCQILFCIFSMVFYLLSF